VDDFLATEQTIEALAIVEKMEGDQIVLK